ncbi:restriction endonuclease, partial [Bacillus paranthracis]
MMWAILLLAGIFLIGAIIKAPEVSREDIRIHREKVKATRSNLEIMDPREFEYFVADVFRSLGYKVQVTSSSNDGGK